MKTHKLSAIVVLGVLFVLFSCKQEPPTDLTQTPIIPKPIAVTATGKAFNISNSTVISVQGGLEETGKYLADELSQISNLNIDVTTVEQAPTKGIYLVLASDNSDNNESYTLDIGKKLATISSSTPGGILNGIQTFLQATAPKASTSQPLFVPTGKITDAPEYAYRGAMLDVARHFFSVEEVKKFIDYLAMYKMNILHLHLSDDQGWRIEIKSWPKLTEIGGSTEVGGGTGGFYTQEQYKELVDYAGQRNITIIPEIDMPGHTNSALASYAELNCDGKARKLYTGTEVGFSTLCTDKEVVYQFLDDVIREISAITPGPYFHIGGDESHSTPIEDYITFINRAQEIVGKYGKKVIGWDEIANAALTKNATVQYWSNVKNTSLGVEKGAKVIISPAARAYLDIKYDSTTTLGLNWAGYIEVDHGYDWHMETLIPGISKENILGIEAPLWSETVTNIDEVEQMTFPRLPGYAEIGWTASENRNWDEYKLRLAKHGKRFEAAGINYYPSPLVPWE